MPKLLEEAEIVKTWITAEHGWGLIIGLVCGWALGHFVL